MRRFQLQLLLALATAAPLSGQRIEESRVAVHQMAPATEIAPVHHTPAAMTAPSRTSASTGAMVTGGLIGGVVGAFAGAVVGMSAENCQGSGDDMCGLAGGILGGLLGEAIGVPIGVNWAANGRGTLKKTIPMSLGLSAVCLVTSLVTYGGSMVMLPPMQIYTSIRAERTGKGGFLFW